MPEGEIYDSRDDGANGSDFGYLRKNHIPPEVFPTYKLFKQPEETHLVPGQLVRYHVEVTQVSMKGGQFALPIAIIDEILS